ncbi:MAG: TAXI family TRAP transporter solute-binding subunit, partial [Phycisphaeraceae bacterium]
HLVGEWANSSSQGENLPLANVMTMFPNIALFITPQSSGIEQITDLRGKRVYVGPEGAGFEYFIRPILKSHGMSFDDISPVYGSQQSAVDYLGDGSVDAAMIGGGVPTGSIVQVANAMPIRFIPFDDEAKAELIANYPSYEEATIPGGTYTGVDEDFLTLNVGSAHIMTATDVDEELVYQATKTIFENREEIAKGHPAARAITPTNVVKDFGVPFHPGAIRYYREAGIWPEDGDVQ